MFLPQPWADSGDHNRSSRRNVRPAERHRRRPTPFPQGRPLALPAGAGKGVGAVGARAKMKASAAGRLVPPFKIDFLKEMTRRHGLATLLWIAALPDVAGSLGL